MLRAEVAQEIVGAMDAIAQAGKGRLALQDAGEPSREQDSA